MRRLAAIVLCASTAHAVDFVRTFERAEPGSARLEFTVRSPVVTTFDVSVNGTRAGQVAVPPANGTNAYAIALDADFRAGENIVRAFGGRMPEIASLVIRTRKTAEGLETSKWQGLIDVAAARGGGRVTVPAGRHLVGGLELRSNVELHLEKGAVLEGAFGLDNYRIWSLPCSEGTWSAVVAGVGVTNVAITGEGEIFGNGGAWPLPSYSAANQEGLRPRGIFFADSRGVVLERFLLRDAACWGVVFKCVDGLRVRDVRIDNHANYNNDGFDIEARNAVFEGCDVDASDDAFVFKSNNPDFVSENILVTNCQARSHCYAYKFGTASHGTMRNVRFVDSKALPPRRDFLVGENPGPDDAIRGQPFWFRRMGYGRYPAGCGGGSLAVECVDGGTVENILFENMELSGATVPLFVRGGTRTGRHNGVPAGNSHIIRNVVFRNIRGEAAGWIASSISGVKGCRVEDITLENVDIRCRGAGRELSAEALTKPVPDVSGGYPCVNMFGHILPAYGLYLDQVAGVTLKNVSFRLFEGECDERPAIGYGEFREDPAKYWSFEELARTPEFRANPFPDSESPGLKAMLVKGKGPADSEAEFFAYYGHPSGPVPDGGFPGVVMVHGGGGIAFPNYVKMWIDQGFAVIALDWYNQRPVFPLGPGRGDGRAELPGGKRNDICANVANITLTHSLLRSMPEVNKGRVVFVGLSWGSWYGAIVTAVDPRYAGAVEIFCGDVTRKSLQLTNGRFLHAAKCPMWWFVSTNDRNVKPSTSADGWNECAKLAGKTIVNDLPHSHGGFAFGGCMRMAKHFTSGEPSLPVLSDAKVANGRISATILDSGKGIDHAKIAWTESADPVSWKRKWLYASAEVKDGVVIAALPPKATQAYLAAYEKDEGRFGELCGTTSFVTPNARVTVPSPGKSIDVEFINGKRRIR